MTTTTGQAPSGQRAASTTPDRRHRPLVVTGILAVVLLSLFCLDVSLGDLRLTVGQTVRSILGTGDPASVFVVRQLRLPRALCAALVGAALGVSGSTFQSVTRNALATPDIIGISGGAACVVAVGMLTFGLTGPVLPLLAIAGACGVGALMYALAWRDGVSGYRLVLIGIGAAAFCAAITSYVLTTKPALEAQRALFWLTGSLNDAGWADVRVGLVALLAMVAAAPLLRRWMTALELGDETAAALGLPVERTRIVVLALATVLAGLAVSMAGPVGFVALVAAPVARGLTGRAGYLHAPAALVGALVVLLADTAGAHWLGELQVPAGVLTAVVGAPYLLWVLARTSRRG